MSTISEILFDRDRFAAGDHRVFCILEDGRTLACDGGKAVPFATMADDDEVVAFQRYLDQRPTEFFLIDVKPGQATAALAAQYREEEVQLGEGISYTSTLTPMDHARMRNIVRKHAKFYFAENPTLAQIDQLIEAIGPVAAQKCVRKAMAKGTIQ